ncbi:MAG: MaoC/PaaZ C-terminal domain-containing protein, partial [Pseudomonadota bacterium]|nr:MaoC/PaaZ C-terminal domain-containing protein [Pseudomonadota bacterium]
MTTVSPSDVKDMIGKEIGVSRWIEVDQQRIDVFADITEDPQFIHVDPERAKAETPFGGTIAHGFLSLSLLSPMAMDLGFSLEGIAMGINYGFE